ncbi:MAG: response regulator [Gloeomargarita sp. SKYG116]|nr:response regulator [Gloeomargarita sp. SKYG116]MDW8400402.1 response regulator [Gloeomargarita sp. SKYGB_i_bin116]
MDAEQYQRILGYFLQEAQEHLATLRQAIAVLEQQQPFQAWEQVADWFRAAHSIKGGAAMLDLEGVRQLALRLEDCFKILRDCEQQRPVQLSSEVIDLFRQGLGALETLIQQVEQTGDLPFEMGQQVVLAHEPAFIQLEALLQIAVHGEAVMATWESAETMAAPSEVAPEPTAAAEAAELNLEELFAGLDVPEEAAATAADAPAQTPEELASLAELFALEPGATPAAQPLEATPPVEDVGALEELAELFTLAEAQPAPESEDWSLRMDTEAAALEALSQMEPLDAEAAPDQPPVEASELLAEADLDEVSELTDWHDWQGTDAGELPVDLGAEAMLTTELETTFEELDLAAEMTATFAELDLGEAELADLEDLEELGQSGDRPAPLGETNLAADTPWEEDTTSAGAAELDWTAEVEMGFEELHVESGPDLGEIDALADLESPDLSASGLVEEATTVSTELTADTAGLLGDMTAELEAALGTFAQPEQSDQADMAAIPAATELTDWDVEQELTNLDDLAAATTTEWADDWDFDLSDAETLLERESESPSATVATSAEDLNDLEQLLETVDVPDDVPDLETLAQQLATPDPSLGLTAEPAPVTAEERSSPVALGEQTMRVPVRQLDNLSNLIGELVVSRNTLNEDQSRLRQFLENLLHQAHQLNDLSQRMQDLYERSLLEGALSATRGASFPAAEAGGQHSTGAEFDALEMDRFTGFHVLSQEIAERVLRVREAAADIEFMVEAIDEVARSFQRITTGLQEGINSARMEPFSRVTDRLPRAVRNVALKCGKQVKLEIQGRETLIDKMILEKLVDPMTHLVNNAIVHGIGTPAQRTAAGQSPTGRIVIRAGYQGNQTVITVSDDGVGINPDRVKAKAIERGLITAEQAQAMSKQDIYQLLFMPGFSTKDQADEFAGRGVGLDVVRKNLAEIRGTVVVDSEIGKGTTFTIRLPLTLSISKSLPCLVSHARVAFPMDGVADVPVEVTPEMVSLGPDGKPLLEWAGQRIPLRQLSELLHYGRLLGRGNIYGTSTQEGMAVVVVHSLGRYVAFQVDQVLSEQEVVIKQLSGPVPKPLGIAGATILGDGRIMMIADVLELVDLALGQLPPPSMPLWGAPTVIEPETTDEPTVLIVDDSITVREMLSMTFSNKGYRVEQARDGLEAWEKLQDGLPCDLIFCDIEMPRMDGLELLSKVRRDPKLKDLPIAMLTSRGAERHRQMAIQLGASAYFTKPYLEETLLEAARRLLQGERLVAPTN